MKKNYLIAVGAMAYGTLVGWATTADHFEQKLKESNETVDVLRAKLRTLKQPTYNIYQNIESPGDSETSHQQAVLDPDGLDSRNLHDDGTQTLSPEAENPRGDETDEVDEAGVAEGETEEETRTNLQRLIDQYSATDDVESRPERDHFVDSAVTSEHDNTPPFVISRASYASDPDEGDEYEKVTVTYYPKQRVLLDEDDEVIDDVNNVIGWKSLARFGDESEDADVVFVRNRRIETDFEVVRDEESPLPLHVKYGLPRDEFEVNKAAGTLRLRDEDT